MKSGKQQNRNSAHQEAPKNPKNEKSNVKSTNSFVNTQNKTLQPSQNEVLKPDTDFTDPQKQEVISDATLEAIQKCMDHSLRAYFIHTMEKIECLSGQLLRSECTFAKMHLDLIERISKLGSPDFGQARSMIGQARNRQTGRFLDEQMGESCGCCNCDDCDDYTEQSTEPLCDGCQQQPLCFNKGPPENDHCYHCNQNVREVCLELQSTKEELEQCLNRLKKMSQTERESPVCGSSIQKSCGRGNQGPSEIRWNQTDVGESTASSQYIPKPPPQPMPKHGPMGPKLTDRNSDYDSENSNSISRKRRSRNMECTSSPERFEGRSPRR